MMDPKFGTLIIERFRALNYLKIEGLGRVNLITGKNNTGKSSVLEALRLLASNGSIFVISDILRFREEDTQESDESARPLDADGFLTLSSLFHGYPQFSVNLKPIVIVANGGQRPMKLSMELGWFSEELDSEGTRRLVSHQPELFGESDALPALVIESGGVKRPLPFDVLLRRRNLYSGRLLRYDLVDESRLQCRFVSPYGGEQTTTLGHLWDKIALSDPEKYIIEALRIIDSNISAVSMVGGEGSRQTRKAIVRAEGIPRPVPLRSFGDGMNRLFGIILSLVNAKDGLLLIDEFENGMHHTIQTDAWRIIFKLARLLNIQVMATSHSWDSIEAFQKAAAEDPEEGVLIRLARKDKDIIPTLFREEELSIATRDRIEVR